MHGVTGTRWRGCSQSLSVLARTRGAARAGREWGASRGSSPGRGTARTGGCRPPPAGAARRADGAAAGFIVVRPAGRDGAASSQGARHEGQCPLRLLPAPPSPLAHMSSSSRLAFDVQNTKWAPILAPQVVRQVGRTGRNQGRIGIVASLPADRLSCTQISSAPIPRLPTPPRDGQDVILTASEQ